MKLYTNADGLVDLITGQSGLELDGSLTSSIIVSLLTDRRALPDDDLDEITPQSALIPPDRRGWAGDALSEDSTDRIGSRLWILRRRKQTEETRQEAIEIVREALQWMIDDGVALSIGIVAEWSEIGRLDAVVDIVQIDGTKTTFNFSDLLGEPNAI
ncbi:MAG: hypothetical protein DI551_09220 [Micavibrio aeruginosavorus]|uniref:Mu-like prophage protein gp46 n=1 Tax=Micavibrio aeruginosavorus TaxID=349221 RepID=A0A2W5MUC0_9BACT|nr:MAG: hypothetical protein DI551_09220 [Micavibrio aeruginosavorus]